MICDLGYFKNFKMRSVSHCWLFLSTYGKWKGTRDWEQTECNPKFPKFLIPQAAYELYNLVFLLCEIPESNGIIRLMD